VTFAVNRWASLEEKWVSIKEGKSHLGHRDTNRTGYWKTQLLSHLASQSYWDNLEARKLFGSQDEDEGLLVTINQKIEKLQSVSQQIDSYENVFKGQDPLGPFLIITHDACLIIQQWQCGGHHGYSTKIFTTLGSNNDNVNDFFEWQWNSTHNEVTHDIIFCLLLLLLFNIIPSRLFISKWEKWIVDNDDVGDIAANFTTAFHNKSTFSNFILYYLSNTIDTDDKHVLLYHKPLHQHVSSTRHLHEMINREDPYGVQLFGSQEETHLLHITTIEFDYGIIFGRSHHCSMAHWWIVGIAPTLVRVTI